MNIEQKAQFEARLAKFNNCPHLYIARDCDMQGKTTWHVMKCTKQAEAAGFVAHESYTRKEALTLSRAIMAASDGFIKSLSYEHGQNVITIH